MKEQFFNFFSEEVIKRPEYYIFKDGDNNILNLKLLAEEAQFHFDYNLEIVHDWAEEWLQHILNLTPDWISKSQN